MKYIRWIWAPIFYVPANSAAAQVVALAYAAAAVGVFYLLGGLND